MAALSAHPGKTSFFITIIEEISKPVEMPRTCSVPGCRSGRGPTAKEPHPVKPEGLSFFSPPKEPRMFEKWVKAIPRQVRPLDSNSSVCSLHFSKEQIETHYETIVANEVVRYPRGVPLLKPWAIPCIEVVDERPTPKELSKVVVETAMTTDPAPGPSFELNRMDVEPLIAKTPQPFSLVILLNVPLPDNSWVVTMVNRKGILYQQLSSDLSEICRRIVVYDNLEAKVWMKHVQVHIEGYETIRSTDCLSSLLKIVANMKLCVHRDEPPRNECLGFVENVNEIFCPLCNERARVFKKKTSRKTKKCSRKVGTISAKNQKIRRFKKKVDTVKAMLASHHKCSSTNVDAVRTQISSLPEPQQENILSCLSAAKKKRGVGNRYTTAWVYHCLLIKIRSNSAYNFLRRNRIMALPAPTTLNNYLKKLKPAFGFQSSLFDVMKKKSEHMTPLERHGTLLLDEMCLSKDLKFDKNQLKIIGFTDLGQYTPAGQIDLEGDHALVFVFQPFHGKWIQALGAFLSRNAAPAQVLMKLIIEAVALTENAGFFVDGVVTDGASWNRGVWKMLGIDDNQCSVPHFMDENRKLHLISDFPHLVKNVRNWVLRTKTFETPDGVVKLDHWSKILDVQNTEGIHLCPKLSPNHINPSHYEKMNVALAYQFFGIDIPAALVSLQSSGIIRDDTSPTCKFVRRIYELIKAMTSSSKKGALWPDSAELDTVERFLEYLADWRAMSDKVLTSSTLIGLVVTLNSALSIFKELGKHGNTFLMTSRLSQDSLEGFFGMVRASGGCNNRPNPTVFINIFRLLSVYSLIKPPKGSNVNVEETFESLISTTAETCGVTDTKSRLALTMDRILDSADYFEVGDFHFVKYTDADEYFAGYVCKRALQFTSCVDCKQSLLIDEGSDVSNYFKERNLHGVLKKPNADVIRLLHHLEGHIEIIKTEDPLCADTFFKIINALQESTNPVPLVGCDVEDHKLLLSRQIIMFYVTTRMHFMCKFANKQRKSNVEAKNLSKLSKLK